MILALLLSGCARPGPWTEDRAIAPALARLDTDHDGAVRAAEYARVAFQGPTFAAADTDGDGALSLSEVEAIVASQDPTTFFRPNLPMPKAPAGAPPNGAPNPPPNGTPNPPPNGAPNPPPNGAPNPPPNGAPAPGAPPARYRPAESLLVLEILAEEVHAKDPAIALPDDARIQSVGKAGSLTSADAIALLGELRDAWSAAGLDFPTGLLGSGTAAPAR